jgi:hypothetical protein
VKKLRGQVGGDTVYQEFWQHPAPAEKSRGAKSCTAVAGRANIESAMSINNPWPRWEYRTIEAKWDGYRYKLDELTELGEDGWLAVTFLPLPSPDPEGFFSTTIGHLLLRRPKR